MCIMQQNIYDDERFFESYTKVRNSEKSFNELLEQPAIKRLLPDVAGKAVLDLGCGFGCNCKDFAAAGATRVVGIDLSERMIEQAKQKNQLHNIAYFVMSMLDMEQLNESFDLVFSSLAFHYVEDFEKLVCSIHSILKEDGVLLFSQEPPVVTASKTNGKHYIRKWNGEIKGYLLNNYGNMGLRKEKWVVDDVEMYHRTFSYIINTLIRSGFAIEAVDEPLPSKETLQVRKGLKKEYVKPTFLIVKAKKGK